MKNCINILLGLLIFASLYARAEVIESGTGKYELKYGLIKDVNSRPYVYRESNKIPFISKLDNPEYKFGYTIDSLNETSFTYYNVLYAPDVKVVTNNWPAKAEKEPGKYVKITNKPGYVDCKKYKECYGSAYYRLDDGEDAAGIYKFEVYVNSKLLKKFEIEIYKTK